MFPVDTIIPGGLYPIPFTVIQEPRKIIIQTEASLYVSVSILEETFQSFTDALPPQLTNPTTETLPSTSGTL